MNELENAWKRGYAGQALADLAAYERLAQQADLPACHRLHFLQMCLEKVAKAHMWQSEKRSERSEKINTSHKFIQKVLPQVYRAYWLERRSAKSFPSGRLRKIKRLCQELDFLAPAIDDEGQRLDNCEYPWQTSTSPGHVRVVVPAEHEFLVLSLLQGTEAVELLK